jgi:FMN phosphatase YigB (HAD superfamily)
MPTPPQTVVLDLGKVLVDFDYSIALRRIAQRCQSSIDLLTQLVLSAPLLLTYERGRLTSEEFYRRTCAATGFCGGFDEFAAAFGDIFSAIEPMVQLHAELRARKILTCIFSNTNELAIRHIRRNFPFFSQFDHYVLSYEHGAMKPEPELYDVVERQTGCAGSQIVYLDDRPENIEAGAARHWKVILHETPEKSRAELIRLGLTLQGRLD